MLHLHLSDAVLLVAVLLSVLIGTQECPRKLQNLQVSSVGLLSLCTFNQQVKGRILLALKEGQKNPSVLPMAHLVGSPIVPFPLSTSAFYFGRHNAAPDLI